MNQIQKKYNNNNIISFEYIINMIINKKKNKNVRSSRGILILMENDNRNIIIKIKKTLFYKQIM